MPHDTRTPMALNDTRIRNAKPREKAYKLTDSGGLHLEVKPTGSKLWRFRYRIGGKENVYALGEYPATGLMDARHDRDEARKLVKQAIHPAHQRKVTKASRYYENANTLEAVGREWLEQNKGAWTYRTHLQRLRVLERSVFPKLGRLPVRQVTPHMVLEALRAVEKNAPTLAVIARQSLSGIFSLAISTMRADGDPTVTLRRALKPIQTKHKIPLKPNEIPAFYKALEAHSGGFESKVALELLMLTLARPVEVIGATWSEIDLEEAVWRRPAERMKRRVAHTTPLPAQAVTLLKRLRAVTGNREHLFPNRPSLGLPPQRACCGKWLQRWGMRGASRHTVSVSLEAPFLTRWDTGQRSSRHNLRTRTATKHVPLTTKPSTSPSVAR